ncbi:hypothetical protein F1559_000181 [Cyanidiococcus yangmingshanensis]|uniref:Probable ATP-dependent transporter ycf16 n=1 Tax=Cyanidiococcus yangmingshanensis TaxID=2690220 RepID=A0A7J7IIU2_9RHOD|nr:hypothetical protein F1559_000181 [Cyanidiococcus yangmingshanensis]
MSSTRLAAHLWLRRAVTTHACRPVLWSEAGTWLTSATTKTRSRLAGSVSAALASGGTLKWEHLASHLRQQGRSLAYWRQASERTFLERGSLATRWLERVHLRGRRAATSGPSAEAASTPKSASSTEGSQAEGNASSSAASGLEFRFKLPDSVSIERLLRLARPHSRLLAGAVAAQITSALSSMAFPLAVGRMIDALNAVDGLEQLRRIAAIMALLFAVGAVAVGARVLLLNITGERVARALRKDLFSAMLRQDTSFFDARSTGELVNRLSADASSVARILTDNVARGIRASITTLSAIGFLVYLSPQLTTVSLCMVPAFAAGVALFGRYARRLSRQLLDALAAANQVAAERIAAIRTVRLFAAEKLELARYGRRIDETYEIARRVAVIEGVYMGAGFLTAQASLLGVLWYGGTMVYHGSMTVGALTSFAMYAVNLGVGVTSLSSAMGQLIRAQGAAARIFEVLDRETCAAAAAAAAAVSKRDAVAEAVKAHVQHDDAGDELRSSANDRAKDCARDNNSHQALVADPDPRPETAKTSSSRALEEGLILPIGYAPPAIEYDDVHFAYPTRPEVPILRGFRLAIEPGELCALVGGSGSGKSTLHMLLARLYDPNRGEVRFAGHGLRKLDASWLRRQIGIVQQEPVLFAGTIAANIAYGREAQRFTQHEDDAMLTASTLEANELQRAAEAAGAHNFISQLPAGYQTCIGERGAGLSGGQIQRIAIARALFHQPTALALDECTSALDLETELHVLDNLLQVIRERRLTALVITHRVPIMKAADRVAVLAGGLCVEHGAFSSLIQNPRGMLPRMLLSDQESVLSARPATNRATLASGTA